MAHATLEAIKHEFDKIEDALVDKVSRGRVADWAEYQRIVGQIHECREGRERTLQVLKTMLEDT